MLEHGAMEKEIWSHLGDRRATLEHLRTFATIALDGGFISASKKTAQIAVRDYAKS